MRERSQFGKLFTYLRHMRGHTQVELARSLNRQNFPISVSAIGKYEFGTRVPTPEFIYHVSKVLNLSNEEQQALINACLTDMIERFMADFTIIASQKSAQGAE